jgi:large subunit ribosomal protein L35
LTRQLAGLAVASQPRFVAAPASTAVRGFRSLPLFATPVARAAPSLLSGNAVTQMQIREMGYKLKSKSSVKKRFKVNSNGLVKRAQANKRHIATKKTRERIRRLGKPVFVEGKIRKNVIKMLPGHL